MNILNIIKRHFCRFIQSIKMAFSINTDGYNPPPKIGKRPNKPTFLPDKIYVDLKEGKVCKGGINNPPISQRPELSKGQESREFTVLKICPQCQGNGKSENKQRKCLKCSGFGYKVINQIKGKINWDNQWSCSRKVKVSEDKRFKKTNKKKYIRYDILGKEGQLGTGVSPEAVDRWEKRKKLIVLYNNKINTFKTAKENDNFHKRMMKKISKFI